MSWLFRLQSIYFMYLVKQQPSWRCLGSLWTLQNKILDLFDPRYLPLFQSVWVSGYTAKTRAKMTILRMREVDGLVLVMATGMQTKTKFVWSKSLWIQKTYYKSYANFKYGILTFRLGMVWSVGLDKRSYCCLWKLGLLVRR